ncbi:glycosyltransferase family 4 protein [Natrialbaceae archaeon A-gly3]
MHVGFVVYGDLEETSGGFRYDRKLARYLESQGDTVEVVSLPWRGYPRDLGDAFARAIRDRLDRSVDVLLQDELCHPSVWWHNPRLEAPGSIVSLVHLLRSGDSSRPLSPFYRAIERRYLESVDAAICTSRDTRERTTDLASMPTVVAPPAGRVEGRALSPEAVRKRARCRPLELVFVGNLIPRKGLLTLLSALEGVDREWRLTVVGSHEVDPVYARDGRKHTRQLGIEGRTVFTGEVTDRELEAILEGSHALLVPARYEGYGMVYLEAMEYGVVPIASAVGGAGEFVGDGENGFLVDPGETARIAEIVTELADDRDLLATLGVAALETAAAHPGWEESMETIRAFLRSFVEGESATPVAEGPHSRSGDRP